MLSNIHNKNEFIDNWFQSRYVVKEELRSYKTNGKNI
jgi:hypothetical protein